MEHSRVPEGCPTCGRVPCLKCVTDVGQILNSFNNHMPDVEAKLDLVASVLRYLEVKAQYRDDEMAKRLIQQGGANVHSVLRRVGGLRQLIQVMALGVCLVLVGFVIGKNTTSAHTGLVEVGIDGKMGQERRKSND